MKREVVEAGNFKTFMGKKYPKIQILTVEELLKGKKPELPIVLHWCFFVDIIPRMEFDWGPNSDRIRVSGFEDSCEGC